MRKFALIAAAPLLASGCATTAGEKWESSSKPTEDAEWRGETFAGAIEDPEQELIDDCRAQWGAVGPPYALKLRSMKSGEEVIVKCDQVRD